MTIKLFLILLLAGLAPSCGDLSGDKKGVASDPRDSSDPTDSSDPAGIYREIIENNFDFVGVVTVNGSLRCSGVLIANGVFVSARHCFSSSEEASSASLLASFRISFPVSGSLTEESLSVSIDDIQYDSADEGINDIAYLFYDASLTNGKITPISFDINTADVAEPGTLLTTVGFPSTSDRSIVKLGTFNCQRLERFGTIGEKRLDPGYSGTLYDTDCYAWKGNSGGGVFSARIEDSVLIPTRLEGVVTHTFEQTELGDIDPDKTVTDEFGSYVVTVNYSSFKDALRIAEVLEGG